jgi:PadR family transcriptional regulator, regulatory protein PadR
MTPQTLSVLEALLDDSRQEAWGFELSRATGLAAGTMYPILARLVAAGWVEDRWEPPEVGRATGRPPRRYYRLSAVGRARATHAVHSAATTRRRDGRRTVVNPEAGA